MNHEQRGTHIDTDKQKKQGTRKVKHEKDKRIAMLNSANHY